MRLLLLAALCLLGPVARADGLSDLRRALEPLRGEGPIRARLELHLWRQITEDRQPVASQARTTVRLEQGPEGLRLTFLPEHLRAAVEESRRQLEDPDRQAPVRSVLRAIEPDEVTEMLDFAPVLLRYLNYMELLGDEQDTFDGRPARMLRVKIAPRLPSNIQKYIKSIEFDARIWLGPDGVPLGFRNNLVYRGSRMLISFDGLFKDERTLQRVGSRLVVVRHVHEEGFSTLGQRTQSRRMATLAMLD
ncbi:MAG: hypothetical protein RMK29_21630 [Myxococcales bacterium]|nr:hypothetical protein [Myxococcota bacterium]MDW8284314.1 hypothetical protein [Myxococcales bacterium]